MALNEVMKQAEGDYMDQVAGEDSEQKVRKWNRQ